MYTSPALDDPKLNFVK